MTPNFLMLPQFRGHCTKVSFTYAKQKRTANGWLGRGLGTVRFGATVIHSCHSFKVSACCGTFGLLSFRLAGLPGITVLTWIKTLQCLRDLNTHQ